MNNRDLLYRNLTALNAVDPHLGERLLNHVIGPSWNIVETGTGLFSASKDFGGGRIIHTSSLIDPLKEAGEWRAHMKTGIEDFVLLGFGLGYHASLLMEKEPALESMVMVEASVDLFALALFLNDLTPLIANPRCRFFVGKDLDSLKPELEGLCRPGLSYGRFLPATEIAPDYYDRVVHILEDIVFLKRSESLSCNGLTQGVKGFLNLLTDDI